jgi:hypothetical protein
MENNLNCIYQTTHLNTSPHRISLGFAQTQEHLVPCSVSRALPGYGPAPLRCAAGLRPGRAMALLARLARLVHRN